MNDVLFKVGDHSVTLGSVLGVILVLVIARLLLWLIKAGLRRRSGLDRLQESRLHSAYLLVKYFIWVAACVISLEVIGINVSHSGTF